MFVVNRSKRPALLARSCDAGIHAAHVAPRVEIGRPVA